MKKRLPTPLFSHYRRHGYRLAEIAAHLDVHYATISRRVRRAEQRNV